jgi:hypothetical protein
MMMEARTIQGPGPLMQFCARVGDDSAFVRIKSSRIEWSLVGNQWVVQMVPMASLSAVSTESGPSRSNLFVTTNVGVADFRVEPETAEQARLLLTRLMSAAESSAAGQDDETDQLINLKWMVDPNVIDSLDLYEEPARVLGF